jgi:signal transduction histidine kinase
MTTQDAGFDAASQHSDSRYENTRNATNGAYLRNIIIVVAVLLILVGLYLLSSYSYLLFHNGVEIFTIVIAFSIFTIAWNSRRIAGSNFFLFLGIAFLFVAGFDLLHTLAYKGMNVFPGFAGSNLATQLWIVTRYILAFTLIISLLLIKRKVKPTFVAISYAAVSAVLVISIFYWKNFPLAYIEGVGLTTFKVASEYAISIIILIAIGLLFKKRKEFSDQVFKLLLLSTVLAIATEMAFTLYVDVYGIANIVGHLLEVVSFYFIYRALIETGLTKPYELLFRNIKQNENALKNRAEELIRVNTNLETEIRERQNIQKALKDSQEQLQLKLNSVLSPNVELGEEELSNIIDVPALQTMMNEFYEVTKMGFALIDLKGTVLAGTGWQEICTKFHRVNPQTCKNCIESDLELSSGLKKGEIRLYKCKNNMWDAVTPLFMGDKHIGNVFFGQFFFDDEKVNRDMFVSQAEQYEFDKEEYMKAFDCIPRFNKERVRDLMAFYSKLSDMISKLSYSNLKLAKSLQKQKELQSKLESKASEVEEYASRMEDLAEERAQKLKDSERLAAIGQTAGMVGHDIRNPLQAMISELYLERTDIESLPDSEAKRNLQESINSIEENVFYINKIVADLQDFARPLNPKKEYVEVGQSIKDALNIVNVPANIVVNVLTRENLPLLNTDSTMLKRVLVNLIQNAVQAMPNGGNLTIETTSKKQQINIAIQDTGEGIPQQVQAKLFTPLMTTKSKGQGFGLAVVKRMTEAIDGRISFESQEGEGTIFTLQFPTN